MRLFTIREEFWEEVLGRGSNLPEGVAGRSGLRAGKKNIFCTQLFKQ